MVSCLRSTSCRFKELRHEHLSKLKQVPTIIYQQTVLHPVQSAHAAAQAVIHQIRLLARKKSNLKFRWKRVKRTKQRSVRLNQDLKLNLRFLEKATMTQRRMTKKFIAVVFATNHLQLGVAFNSMNESALRTRTESSSNVAHVIERLQEILVVTIILRKLTKPLEPPRCRSH